MANWCQNWVNFSGEESQINKMKSLFKAMEIKEKEMNEGQIPSFMKEPKQDWFFNIYADETDTISYETKWSPNTYDLVEIANHFRLSFEHMYEESGNNIFGKAVFTSGNIEPEFFDLDDSDFDLFQYDTENDIYTYEGQEYESNCEILETIFEKKFKESY